MLIDYRLMTELDNLASTEPESPGSYRSNHQASSPSNFLGLEFRPRARGSSCTSQNSERESLNEAPGSPHPLVGKERFDTTPINCIQSGELGDENFQDDDPEERFSNPVKYFEDLEILEEDLVDHSSLKTYDGGDNFVQYPDSSKLSSVITRSDEELLNLWKNHGDLRYAQTALHLLLCRNIMFAVFNNCCKLIEAGFGGHRINFLTIDRHRNNVAKLIHCDASSIKALAEDFDYALSEYLRQADDSKLARDALGRLNQACYENLLEWDLWSWGMNLQPDEAMSLMWYSVCQTLDLAVLSFVGAHCQDFSKFLEKQSESFNIPGPSFQLPGQITLRSRHFQCLDGLFGGKPVWVFHPHSKTAVVDEPLYLSAKMKSFSHIWGPVWAISKSGHVTSGVQQYDVGGGSILPWRQLNKRDPIIQEGEVFCHWVPYEQGRDGEILNATLGEDDTLLIGAKLRLRPNDEKCPFKPKDLVKQFQDSNALHNLGTSDSTFFVDSQSSAISLGGWGLNVSGSRTFKKRDGQTLKAALLERWDHDREGGRMIGDLEKGYGLEMSYCSLNSRRTTLFNLLRSKGMMEYLKELDWDDDQIAIRVLEILRNETTQDLQKIYRTYREWRKDIRDLILHALRILAQCTVDESTHELSIPWMSGNFAHSATFSQRDISWVGFLQDTRDSATFGLLANRCLSFNQRGGRICGQYSGSPVLQTSLRINTSMTKNHMRLMQRSSGEYFWSVSAITKKWRFPLGSQGNLTAVGMVEEKGALLMEWASEAEAKTFVKRAFRWNGGKHHQEFIRAKWNATERPILIFIESKYEVPAVVKRHRKHRHRKSDTKEPGYYLPSSSVPQITYTPHDDISPISQRDMQITRTETESSAPISIPRSSSLRSRHDDEAPIDLSSDDGSPGSERNQWKWDKNYKKWRQHVYTDGELDYTRWSRNPDLADT